MITSNRHLYKSVTLLKEYIDKNISNSDKLLVQIFFATSDRGHIQEIQQILNTKLPHSHIIGTSTDGVVHNAQSLTFETVISFTQFEKSDLKHVLIDFDIGKEEEAAQKISKTILDTKTKVLILFADGITCNGEKLIRAIDKIYPDIVISGGLAGDNAEFIQTVVCDNNTYSLKGIVGLSISSDSLIVNTEFNFDWTQLGKDMTITKCDANRVYQIDNMSTYDTYKKYLGENAASLLPAIGVEFPLIIKDKEMVVARAAAQQHDDGSLSFAGNFHEGQTVRLGVGNTQQIINSAKEIYYKLKDKPIEVIFVYSCMARRRFLGENISYELSALNE